MVFEPPAWVLKLPFDPPDDIPIPEFIFNEQYGRLPFNLSKTPFTCGLSGAGYSINEVQDRVRALASSLTKELGFATNQGSEWDKVICVYSVNTIDTPTVNWAIQYLSGISSPANAAYSEDELTYQLKSSGAKAIFTCLPLLQTSISAAAKCGIPKDRIYLLALPKELIGNKPSPAGFKTVGSLIEEGKKLGPLERFKWRKGQGARQTAFLCYSSGTSGLPKGVMISHRNVIANVLQIKTYESKYRDSKKKPGDQWAPPHICLGLLPQSHIYSLVLMGHAAPYRGDQVINLPKFDMGHLLSSIQCFKIGTLFLVPPIIIAMANNAQILSKFDLTSVIDLFTGAAPLGAETADAILKLYPSWQVRQGYGLTETSTVIASTASHDIYFGTCGSLLPGVKAKIVSPEGKEITDYDTRGELVVHSPSVTIGYLRNAKATQETFDDGWMRTGDEAIVTLSPAGYEHITIVDRIKELIKVKGHQVAPAELEAHLLSHDSVSDCCVISIPDARAGERPKAYIVKAVSDEPDDVVEQKVRKHVEQHKTKYKWLAEVEFIDIIPKSPSGKILRRLLRDKDREARKKRGAKL